MKVLVAIILSATVAPCALAQSAQVPSSSAQKSAPSSVPVAASSSLNLQLPPSQNVPYEDDPPKAAHDSNTSVHGSVSTTVGYAKGLGTSTAEGVNLDVDHTTDNGNHVGMSINVMQGRNLPYYGYPGYGGYPYGYSYGRRAWERPSPAPAPASSSGDDN